MKRTWLVIDGNYLAWRTFHSTGRLTNGVQFGFLKDVQYLSEQHATPHLVFAFDHGRGKRQDLLPSYKGTRRAKELTDEEREQIEDMRRQVDLLKTTVLQEVGFKNVFYQDGYEADDVCAKVVQHNRYDDFILVSADRDLLQLLRPNVCLWNPHQRHCYTDSGFRDEWGLEPEQWVMVKAIAGCSTDDVPGVRGVGEKTAAKFLRGELAEDSSKFKAITDTRATWEKNLPLVTLPLPGLKEIKLDPGTVDARAWNKMAEQFGMRSLSGRAPGSRGTGFGIRPKV